MSAPEEEPCGAESSGPESDSDPSPPLSHEQPGGGPSPSPLAPDSDSSPPLSPARERAARVQSPSPLAPDSDSSPPPSPTPKRPGRRQRPQSLPARSSLDEQLAACKAQVQRLEKLLSQSQRQNRTTASYNEDLRKQVDVLSKEIHERKKKENAKTDAEAQTEEPAAWSQTGYYYYPHENYYPNNDAPPGTVPVGNESQHSVPVVADPPVTVTNVHTSISITENGQNEPVQDAGFVPGSEETVGSSLAESLRATAEAALSQTGFTYDEHSGLYYDNSTGFYYDSENQLYYDANTGIYYYCDAENGRYVFHSRIDLQASQAPTFDNRGKNKRRAPWGTPSNEGQDQLFYDADTGIYYACDPAQGRYVFHSRVDLQAAQPPSLEQNKEKRATAKRMLPCGTSHGDQAIKMEEQKTPSLSCEFTRYVRTPSTEQEEAAKKAKMDSYMKDKTLQCMMSVKSENGHSELEMPSTKHSAYASDSDPEETNSEAEEGELNDSEMEGNYSLEDVSSEAGSDNEASEDEDPERIWPPCIRVMVIKSPVLETGTLFIITAVKRATIGSEGGLEHTIQIAEADVSKFHAEVYFDHSLKSYVLVDQGSKCGTIINGNQILQPSIKCEPCVLSHGDEVKFGDTVLSFHVHPGSKTCDGCEPGQVRAHLRLNKKQELSASTVVSRGEKEMLRRKQMKQLRVKYGLQNTNYEENQAVKNPKYRDLAENRRKTVGSEGTFKRDDAPASVNVEINSTNKGHRMLKKMGWKKGQGLGKAGAGIIDPIQLEIRRKKAGLGAESGSSIDDVAIKTQNNYNWEKARERFFKNFQDAKKKEAPKATTWVKGD